MDILGKFKDDIKMKDSRYRSALNEYRSKYGNFTTWNMFISDIEKLFLNRKNIKIEYLNKNNKFKTLKIKNLKDYVVKLYVPKGYVSIIHSGYNKNNYIKSYDVKDYKISHKEYFLLRLDILVNSIICETFRNGDLYPTYIININKCGGDKSGKVDNELCPVSDVMRYLTNLLDSNYPLKLYKKNKKDMIRIVNL